MKYIKKIYSKKFPFKQFSSFFLICLLSFNFLFLSFSFFKNDNNYYASFLKKREQENFIKKNQIDSSNDSSNVINISLSEYKSDLNNSVVRKVQSVKVFSTPIEKYLGYYLKKHFNLSPIFFLNLSESEKQLYKDYIYNNPDKEYLKKYNDELEDEKIHPEKYKKDHLFFKLDYFSLKSYDFPWGWTLDFNSIFIADLFIEGISLIISGITVEGVFVKIIISFALSRVLSLLKNKILQYLGWKEKGPRGFVRTGKKKEFGDKINYQNFTYIAKRITRINYFQQNIYFVYLGYHFDVLIPHPYVKYWKKIWFISYPVFGWDYGHFWFNITKSDRVLKKVEETKELFDYKEGKDLDLKEYLKNFKFSFENYNPHEILEILELNKRLIESKDKHFLFPKRKLGSRNLKLRKISKRWKNRFSLFPQSVIKKNYYLNRHKLRFNNFFFNDRLPWELGKQIKMLERKKSLIKELEKLFNKWKKNPTFSNKKLYRKKLKEARLIFTKFKFGFVSNHNNSKKQIAIVKKDIKKLDFVSLKIPIFSELKFCSQVRFFLNQEILTNPNDLTKVNFIVFDKKSPLYLNCLFFYQLLNQKNDNLLSYSLLDSFSILLKDITLNFVDWYGNFEIISASWKNI